MSQYIIPALLSLVVTITGGIILWFFKKKRLVLEYELIESECFPQKGKLGKYFVIKLLNSGNHPISDIDYSITFANPVIDSYKFSEPTIAKVTSETSTEIKSHISLLNPDEEVSLTITTIGHNGSDIPKVIARAYGVTAVRAQKNKAHELSSIFSIGVALLTIIISLTVFWTSLNQTKLSTTLIGIKGNTESYMDSVSNILKEQVKKLEELDLLVRKNYEEGKPETGQIFFSILNIAGLGHLYPKLAFTGDELSNWKTGIFLMNSFLVDQKNKDKYIEAMKGLLSQTNMMPASRGFNLYLLAKMLQFIGNTADANRYLEECKKETPQMYQHLMSQDSSYDLKIIQRVLIKDYHAN